MKIASKNVVAQYCWISCIYCHVHIHLCTYT